jgi:predicted MFS family arabinose efflux permease
MYLSGALADLAGFSTTFLILVGINLLILPLITLVFQSKEKSETLSA